MTNTKTGKNTNKKQKELDLGQRKVSHMNYSDVVTLPKTFTKNCLDENMVVKMAMLKDGCLKLTPVCKTSGEETK